MKYGTVTTALASFSSCLRASARDNCFFTRRREAAKGIEITLGLSHAECRAVQCIRPVKYGTVTTSLASFSSCLRASARDNCFLQAKARQDKGNTSQGGDKSRRNARKRQDRLPVMADVWRTNRQCQPAVWLLFDDFDATHCARTNPTTPYVTELPRFR